MTHDGSTTSFRRSVHEHFDANSSWWGNLYLEVGVENEIYRLRLWRALEWIEGCKIPKSGRILEIGCGAGFLTVELAKRGYIVNAVDVSEPMLRLAHANAQNASVIERVRLSRADVHALPFRVGSMDLVVALGLISWLASPRDAMCEVARVMKPGGYVLFSTPNRACLRQFLDPARNFQLAPLKRKVLQLTRLGKSRPTVGPRPKSYQASEIDRLLLQVGLSKVVRTTIGFGPFTILYRKVVPEATGIGLHRLLQRLADRGVPGVRSTGRFHLVLAGREGEVDGSPRL
jgi:2-polyprenyl-3-methyl-5-hydroxy-6-metoxy-1,4-benzoquinol methylase